LLLKELVALTRAGLILADVQSNALFHPHARAAALPLFALTNGFVEEDIS